mgnify:CR=1 FL=1
MAHEEFEHEANATASDASPDARVAARRRFLKGTTLALPAVMTLHSVAAQATARSSGTQCANNVPQSPCIHLRDQPDDYFRQKVACYSKLNYDSVKKIWRSNNTATYFQGINCTNQQQCWRYCSDGSIVPNTEIPQINCATNVYKKPSSSSTSPISYKHAIVHFSAIDGSVMAVGEPQTPVGCIMTSITMACLNAITGHRV